MPSLDTARIDIERFWTTIERSAEIGPGRPGGLSRLALSDADKQGLQKAATEAGLLQRQLLDEGDKEVVAKFEKAGVKVNAVSAEELKRIQDKLKPVTAKFAPQIGEDFLKEFNAEIEKARAAK